MNLVMKSRLTPWNEKKILNKKRQEVKFEKKNAIKNIYI